MAVNTTNFTTPAQSINGTLQRTVSDKIRKLFPGTAIMALIQSGLLGSGDSDVVRKTGVITKRRVNTPKYEVINYNPLSIIFKVGTASDGSTFIVSDADGLVLRGTLMNTSNNTTCRVSSLSSTTVTYTSFGGTAFSAAVGDELMALGPAYQENSTSPHILMKTEDISYNETQIVRFPVSISASAEANPHFGSEPFFSRVKKYSLIEGLRKVENTLIWSERSSSEGGTSDSTLSDTFRTTRGMFQWAANSFDAAGALTRNKFVNDMVKDMGETMQGDQTSLIMLCGREVYGAMLEWVEDKINVDQNNEGSYKRFGVKTKVFTTAGPEIEVVIHDSFNRGSNRTSALIFNPEMLEYTFLRDRDLKPSINIQANDADGRTDEIIGEIGLDSTDAGASILKITNAIVL